VLIASLLLVPAVLAYGVYHLWQAGMLPANEAAEHWYEVESEQVVLVELPRDDAPHTDYMEWWYYNGHLEADDGRRFAFHYVTFAVNALATHTAKHASFIDLQTGRHFTAQKRTSGNPSRGTKDSFRFELGEWHMVGGDGNDRLRVSTPEFSFNLKLTEGAPPVMQGGTGLLSFELTGSSYYYSRPRMPAKGAVKLDGEIVNVTGVAWFDHQWGDFEVNELGWDWFALQLDDGTDIMLYQLFDSDGLPVLMSGTAAQNGQTTVLTETDFEVIVTERWTSPRTGIEYPMGWTVAIPSKSLQVSVSPLLRNSEFDGRTTSYKVYWEGPVEISGSHSGIGFVEMSGYKKAAASTP
jgi:predicted secreted hydrolase